MNEYDDLLEYFDSLIELHRAVDVANAEFRRIMAEDPELRTTYRNWCADHGYNPRNAFNAYAEEYLEQQDSIWDALNDYDDNE